jgi:hypothetical protein
MPEPGGIPLAAAEGILAGVREHTTILGVGFSGLLPDPANVGPITRLATALGL